MIKAAVEYIVGLGKSEIHRENGQIYSDKHLHLVEVPTACPFEVNTLSSLISYLKSNFDSSEAVIVHIASPTEVTIKSSINGDKNRDYFIKAKALIPEVYFDNWYDSEKFNIKLQSCFVKNDDRDVMLKVIGNIKEEDVKTFGDNGVSQSVTAKVGVATVGQVEVPNPVVLKPYRTFVEVDQPESEFIFRMKNGPSCALFEADGGAWKLQAMANIKEYLQVALEEEIGSRKVVIIA